MTTLIFKSKRKTAGQLWQLINRIMLPGVFCLLLCSSSLNDLMTMIANCPLLSSPHAKSVSYFQLFLCSVNCGLLVAMSPQFPGERQECTQDSQESNPGPSSSEPTSDNNHSATPAYVLVCNLEELSFLANLHMTSYEWSLHIARYEVFWGKLHVYNSRIAGQSWTPP